MNILTLNAGSATLKCKLIRMPDETVLSQESVDHPGGEGIAQAAEEAIARCRHLGIDATGHRVVHGGAKFAEPTRATPAMLDDLRQVEPMDPLHNPVEVAMIETAMRLLPNSPAVAVFDTAFHRTMTEVAWRYAIPREFADGLGLRRYGFHGISHRYVSERLLARLQHNPLGTKLITCHLGGGASVCAIEDGRSIDTSMGMTPLEGLVMGTRCGDIDPGLLLYLMRTKGTSAADLDDLLNHRSGLLGISGRSADVRELEAASRQGDEVSEMALEIFAYRVRKYIGAFAAALGGIDAIAFCGGIGEHSAAMRARICHKLGFLGVDLDPSRNEAAGSETKINADTSHVGVWMIPTDEELQIARETMELLSRQS